MTFASLQQLVGGNITPHGIEVPSTDFDEAACTIVDAGFPLVFMYATDERRKNDAFAVHAVFSVPKEGFFTIRTTLKGENPAYPSLTKYIMAAHWFERSIADQFGIIPEGHPDPRRLMHHENIPEGVYPLRTDFDVATKLPHADVPYPMHRVEGEGIYEIPVGPIHAGIIEPGHFRFNVRGERILSLEGKLFFKHKGVEKLIEGKTPTEAMPFIEHVSGDMVVAHALAFAQAVEHITGTCIPDRAKALRVFWNELERVTAHIFDIGNMAGMGTGFTFMAVQGFRIVEELRRMHGKLTGHRFLRGAIMIGGAYDIGEEDIKEVLETLSRVEREMEEILTIAQKTDGLKERLETTGVLSFDAARDYGARGVAARASGVAFDTRIDHSYALYEKSVPTLVTETAGDVMARFMVRVRELRESLRLIRTVLAELPGGETCVSHNTRAGEALGWSEGFRGAVIDFVRIGDSGHIERCAISDPSFMNWPLFGELGPGNIVPDFPLCNKSLNLSYSGTDL